MSSVAVALTTDQTGTRALERAGVSVQWMTCTATVGESGRATTGPGNGTSPRPTRITATPGSRNVATVSCEGQTKDGKEIRIRGRVTDERDGRCVRGDITAVVSGRTVFRLSVLGDCNAPTSRPTSHPTRPTPPPTQRPTWNPPPTWSPPPTWHPPTPTREPQPRPTVTVTVTADPPPQPPPPEPTPTCSCPPGN
ncbi:hypothetical protein ACFYVL_18580 [Streptomyces sp. NPDC004111]|uniref:hypothetical protein n=1 Tax=Streptomyces sp. NPDC004111 TaxID=3364690 RepID=UPI0036B416CC